MSPDGSQQVAKDWDISHLAKLVCACARADVHVSHLPAVCVVAFPSLDGCIHSSTTSSLCFCLLLTERGGAMRADGATRDIEAKQNGVCVGGGGGCYDWLAY